jgi:RimJ/RimL family protein N-acetyltransferase
MNMETDRLILRKLTTDDLEELHTILSDVESMQHYPKPFDLNKSKKWIAWNIENYTTYGFGLWAVTLKEDNQFIGDCGITMQNINGRMEPEIGYHINKKYVNKGYATEAVQVCMKYAFEILKFDKVYSYMKYTNIPSQRVAEKNGMKLIMEYEDKINILTKVYAITNDEYKKWKYDHS